MYNGLENSYEIMGRLNAAQQARLLHHIKKVDRTKLEALSGHHKELSEFLIKTGDDGENFLNRMDDPTLKKMFTLTVRDADPEVMQKMRVNLVKLHTLNENPVSIEEIKSFIDNTEKLKNVKFLKIIH